MFSFTKYSFQKNSSTNKCIEERSSAWFINVRGKKTEWMLRLSLCSVFIKTWLNHMFAGAKRKRTDVEQRLAAVKKKNSFFFNWEELQSEKTKQAVFSVTVSDS